VESIHFSPLVFLCFFKKKKEPKKIKQISKKSLRKNWLILRKTFALTYFGHLYKQYG
jgi:hypothetical protein